MCSESKAVKGARIFIRVLAAVFGGYAFTAGFAAMAGTGLPHFGVTRLNAMMFGALSVYPIYLVIALWSFSTKKLTRTSLILVGASLAMINLAPNLVLEG